MNNGDMRYKLLQPWSTFVMITKVPPSILEKMIKITDEIVTNVKSMPPGATGSGQLKDEFSLEQEILEREGLLKYFLHMTRQFVIEQTLQQNPLTEEKKLNNDKWYTSMTAAWIVSQKDNEYQPVHTHSKCHISSVMYLKIPEYLPNRNPINNDDGSITFTSNVSNDPTWGVPFFNIQPVVGDFFIFPASQVHQVYPFRTADGKGERRSMSFNAKFSTKKV